VLATGQSEVQTRAIAEYYEMVAAASGDPKAAANWVMGDLSGALNAVGKDFLPDGSLFAVAPSGSGFQVSLYGLAGILLAAREGLEVNLLGLSFGIDAVRPAVKLPALGRLGMARL